MKARRFAFLVAMLGCVATGAFVPAAGCTGTGTTPVCDFPDGAFNPDSGCGVLIEASVDGAPAEDVALAEDTGPVGQLDASDGSDASQGSDATLQDASADGHVSEGTDATDAPIKDSAADAGKG